MKDDMTTDTTSAQHIGWTVQHPADSAASRPVIYSTQADADAHAAQFQPGVARVVPVWVRDAAQPVAWVPVHPRNGPLWAMATNQPDPERLPSYPLQELAYCGGQVAAPETAPAVPAPDVLAWAVSRWCNEVQHRPLVNKNRRPLDDAWRQVIRFAGGDPDALVGPCHDAITGKYCAASIGGGWGLTCGNGGRVSKSELDAAADALSAADAAGEGQ